MPAWSKRIQGLSIKEENCFLGLVNNELRARIEVFWGVFPDKSLVIALIFDDIRDAHSPPASMVSDVDLLR